jgi:hypothetical protein
MKSRAARLILLLLFIAALGTTAYLFWNGESLARAEAAAVDSIESKARQAARTVLEVRAAQQAYVAPGQSGEFWPGRVGSGIDAARGLLAALRAEAVSQTAANELDSASSTLDDFAQLDRRVRGYIGTGQNVLAADLIFSDGVQMTGAIDSRVEQARGAEITSREAAIQTFRARQNFALIAAAAAAFLVVLLLLPGAESDRERVSLSIAEPASKVPESVTSPEEPLADIEVENWTLPKRLTVVPKPEPEPQAEPLAGAATETPGQELPIAAHTDFSGVALLCTDLARVIDTQQLPSLLDRASSLLDAKGIILWIADPEGRELNPIVAHGYAPQLVDRLGRIPRDAENATAAAFRTALLQTVRADAESNGAIAAPLVTPGGCVGVMAAEVRHEGEREESRLAAAAIVAAQLATLVGPPPKTNGRAEAV